MKSFLLKGKRPIIKWGMLPDEIYYEGEVPDGYNLAVCPSGGMIVIDVDKHGHKNGFDAIPEELKEELKSTLHYATKNDGAHFWFYYTGERNLGNKTSGKGIDLRTHKGYVVWYPNVDVRAMTYKIKETSKEMNLWLEKLFSYIKN